VQTIMKTQFVMMTVEMVYSLIKLLLVVMIVTTLLMMDAAQNAKSKEVSNVKEVQELQ
jgi:hypothetical protein